MPTRAMPAVFTSRTRRSVSIVRTTHSAAYAMRIPCASSSTNQFVPSEMSRPCANRAMSTPATTSIHMRMVAASPMRPSRLLPASTWAEPGNRKFRPTNHQPRRLMTEPDDTSG